MLPIALRCTSCNDAAMEKLSAYLKEKGISQNAFARLVGIHPSVVSRYLNDGVKPTFDLAAKIESVTGGAVPLSAWVGAS